MILWTIQPEDVFSEIQNNGVYRCDINKSGMKDFADLQYDWLVSQMKKRIGPPPEGVSYPVWAWYKWREDRKKPDLRAERWHCGRKGKKFYLLEVDIPDDEVLLLDFNSWIIILNEGLLSSSEEEDNELEKIYKALNAEEQKDMQSKNWEKVFDITPFESEWTSRGDSIQAVFWELRKEQVRKFKIFISSCVYR
ncbi:MAG: DUF3841 domain-containing protein [Synergistaceae bacterium]|nr:DUF3841 domain-containing protein [Synergistaceae bacterium]